MGSRARGDPLSKASWVHSLRQTRLKIEAGAVAANGGSKCALTWHTAMFRLPPTVSLAKTEDTRFDMVPPVADDAVTMDGLATTRDSLPGNSRLVFFPRFRQCQARGPFARLLSGCRPAGSPTKRWSRSRTPPPWPRIGIDRPPSSGTWCRNRRQLRSLSPSSHRSSNRSNQ